MQMYAILRRSGWKSPEELRLSAQRSLKVAEEEMPDEVRWIRSYVLDEGFGSVGTICIYEAMSEEAVRRHGVSAELPVDEVIPIMDTVIVRPDPVDEASSAVGHG